MRDVIHDQAMAAMDEAEALAREQRLEAARQAYERAAALEQRSADAQSEDRPRARGVLRVSAVSLWMRAGRYREASDLAHTYLAEPLAPGSARQLHELLTEIEGRLIELEAVPSVPQERASALLEHLAQLEKDLASGAIPLLPLRDAA